MPGWNGDEGGKGVGALSVPSSHPLLSCLFRFPFPGDGLRRPGHGDRGRSFGPCSRSFGSLEYSDPHGFPTYRGSSRWLFDLYSNLLSFFTVLTEVTIVDCVGSSFKLDTTYHLETENRALVW